MVGRPDGPTPPAPAGDLGTWEPWEARRAKAPPGLPVQVREARWEAKILLEVARARLARGETPVDLVEPLAGAAQDERLTACRRLIAAELLARVRLAVLTGDGRLPRARQGGGPGAPRRPGGGLGPHTAEAGREPGP